VARKDVSDLQVCFVYWLRSDFHFKQWPEQILSTITGEPEKVCFRAMERAYDRDLIEYGMSLRAGWLSDKGRELLSNASGEDLGRTIH